MTNISLCNVCTISDGARVISQPLRLARAYEYVDGKDLNNSECNRTLIHVLLQLF